MSLYEQAAGSMPIRSS